MNKDKLFKLMQEHPELPVIPMVESEVVCDDSYGYWMGSWGDCRIDKFIVTEDRIYFIDADKDEILLSLYDWEWVDEVSDEEYEQGYKNINWIDAIIVNINTPEY